MKKAISTIKRLLLIVLIGGFVIAGSTILRNKIFYKSGLVSKDIFALNDKINLSNPEDTSEKRTDLLKEIDNFAKSSVSGKGFSPKIYSLIKVRLDQALQEISTTKVPQGKVKIWYIYNMGVIAKSSDKTIAFDLAGAYVYSNMADFTKYIDVLFITHFHNDHFEKSVVQQALENGVTVVIPDEKVKFEEGQFIKDSNGENILDFLKKHSSLKSDNLITIKPLEKTIIKDIEVTAYPCNHQSNLNENSIFTSSPLDWYYVNLSGITFLDMGDGNIFDHQPDFTNKKIDVFITHNTDPKTNDDLIKIVPNAKIILPLHVWELGHGSDIVNYMNYKSIIEDDAKLTPMIWGESLLF